MKVEPTCPRCAGPLHAPNLWSSDWVCDRHGAVHPCQPLTRPSPEALAHIVEHARVPVWLPWPLPSSWLVTGFAQAGDDRTGRRATAVAVSGPAPLGGPADLVVVAEEPGIGMGARFAGLPGPDPGRDFDAGAPHAKIEAAGHPTALWSIDAGPEVAVFVGEAKGLWLWTVLWPASAGVLLLERVILRDLRDELAAGVELDLPYGALSPRLSAPPPAA